MNKVRFGFRNVVYSVITIGAGGAISYGTVKSFMANGCHGISIGLSPAGDENQKYGDDVVIDETINNNGYDGDLVLSQVSDDFKKDVLGYEVDANGVLFENADAPVVYFALGFEVQGNEAPKRTWYLYCSAGRPNDEHATNEQSKTYGDATLTIKARPRPDTRRVKNFRVKQSGTDTIFEEFFDDVYDFVEPTPPVPEP